MIFCEPCGVEVGGSDKRCPLCGAPLSSRRFRSRCVQEGIGFTAGPVPGMPPAVRTSTTLQKGSAKGFARFRFDNAGMGFSLICDRRLTTVFRLEATWKKPVEPERLRNALSNVLPRFPCFQVQRKSGFSWYYWEKNPTFPPLESDVGCANRYIPLGRERQFPFRIKLGKYRIALEVHHCLTDGFGGLALLKSLLLEYAKLGGARIKDSGDIFAPEEKPQEKELEDSYQRYYRKGLPRIPILQRRAFILPIKREPSDFYHLLTGVVSTQELCLKAKEFGTHLNVLIIALYLETLQEIQQKLFELGRIRRLKPLRLMVPINLRRLYPSRTLRNFTLFITPGIDTRLGLYGLREITEHVESYMKCQTSTKLLNCQIARNVGSQNNPFLAVVPLLVKKLFAGLFYYLLGSSLHSGMLTNLGLVALPEVLAEQLASLRFVPAPLKTNRVGAAMIGFRDRLYICFGRLIREPLVEKGFFRRLGKLGVKVCIVSDR